MIRSPLAGRQRSNEAERMEATLTRRLKALAAAIALIGAPVARLASAQQPEIATAVAFTEGPTVDRDGNVYFTEMVWQRIMKLSAKGELSTFREHSNNANGLLIDPQGRLVACEGAESQRTGVRVTFKPQVTRTDRKSTRLNSSHGYISYAVF